MHERAEYLQSREHISRADTIDPNTRMRPLDRQARSQVPYCCLRSVVGRLRLRHVHNCAGHGSDHDNASC